MLEIRLKKGHRDMTYMMTMLEIRIKKATRKQVTCYFNLILT